MLVCRTAACDVVVDTGDICGWGGLIERVFIRRCCKMPARHLFVLGNHDDDKTALRMTGIGTEVISGQPKSVAGIAFWGYADPNRTRPFGAPYDRALCEEASRNATCPVTQRATDGPLVVMVHNEAMVKETAFAYPPSLILSGHLHSPANRVESGTVYVRSGALGGRGPLSREHAMTIADIDAGGVLAVRTITTEGSRIKIDAIDL